MATKPTRSTLTHDAQMIRMSRHIARLERRATELRRELRTVVTELRSQKRALRGYAQEITDAASGRGFHAPPLRMFGERQGGQ